MFLGKILNCIGKMTQKAMKPSEYIFDSYIHANKSIACGIKFDVEDILHQHHIIYN